MQETQHCIFDPLSMIVLRLADCLGWLAAGAKASKWPPCSLAQVPGLCCQQGIDKVYRRQCKASQDGSAALVLLGGCKKGGYLLVKLHTKKQGYSWQMGNGLNSTGCAGRILHI